MQAPETLLEAVSYFSNPENAFEFFKVIRWPNGVRCPRCGSDKVTFLENARVWKCRTPHAKQKFSAKVGTIFEDSPIGLEKWLPAMWLAANCKNGISSYELHRAIGVTQKTAWFMLQRIRLAMQDGSIEKMKGRVEADETYIGAKARFMHKDKRSGKTGMVGKTAVLWPFGTRNK
jgi:transposase-like protein